MRQIITTGLLFLLLTASNVLWAQTTRSVEHNLLTSTNAPSDLKEKLIFNKSWVKYPQYTDREDWQNLFGKNKASVIAQGEKYLDYKWQVVTATNYLDYNKKGVRVSMENPNLDNTNALSTLFIAELAEGEGRFVDQLINGVFSTCEMTSWVLSAHLPVQKTGSSLPNHNEQIIDLVSGDIGGMMSWIHYFFNKEFDKVDPYISQRLKYEITQKILIPYSQREDYWWMSLDENRKNKMINNWNPWCNANILQCFFLIEDNEDTVTEAVYKSMRSVDKFINYVRGDGACEEGPAYWGHAAGKLYDYLQILHDATGGKVSLLNEPMIRHMGEYISRSYVGDNWVVNFADASARMGLNAHHIYRYGRAVGSQEMMQFGAYLEQQYPEKYIPISRDVYRSLEQIASGDAMCKMTPTHNNPEYTWYPETEFCYTQKGNLFFAAKGGFNNESHNHNDVGTFSLYLNNTPIFIDAGVGTYTKKTFSNERYDIWSMQSDYHNLPRINGFSQKFGNQYKAKNTALDKNKNTFSLDIADAYPAEAGIKQWTRQYKIENNGLKIEDNFSINNPTQKNQINFLVWGVVDLSKEGVVSIDTQGQIVSLEYDKNLFRASVKTIEQDDRKLSNIWGKEIYRISLDALNVQDRGKYNFTIKYIK